MCGAPDNTFGSEEINGIRETVHFVKIELRYFEREDDIHNAALLRRLERGGFRGPIVVNGRKAMQRMACVDCLNIRERSRKVWGELKAQALKLERNQGAEENYYALLCDVDES